MTKNNIEFSGAKCVLLSSLLYKIYSIFYYGQTLFNSDFYETYRAGKESNFNNFILKFLKDEDTIKNIVDSYSFKEEEVYLICSFMKDNNGAYYSKSSVDCLKTIDIKKIIFEVIKEFAQQEIFLINDKEQIDLKENLQECIKNGNPNVEFKDLVNI